MAELAVNQTNELVKKSTLSEADLERIKKIRVTSFPSMGSRAGDAGFLSKLGSAHREIIKISPALQSIVSQFSGFDVLEKHVAKSWKAISFGTKLRWQKTIIDEYTTRFEGLIIGPRCFEKMLIELCCDLYDRGYLISEDQFRTQLKEKVSTVDKKITSIGFVTGNRVESLIRAVESYGKNCLDHGRPTRIVVSDDSMDPTVQEKYQQGLRELKKKYGFEITYIDASEKKKFVGHLVEKGIRPDLLEFALLRGNEPVSAYGKNRNALSLACVGELYFSADDDTHCVLHKSPSYKKGVRLGTEKGALVDIQAFESREKSLAYTPTMEGCILDLHERVLGKSLAECVVKNEGDELVDFSDKGRSKLNLLKGKGRVSLSFNGLVGDSGSGDARGHLFVKKDRKKEVFQSREYYELYSNQRDICKSTSQIQILQNNGCMTTFYGIDATKGLPPYFPYFRMEDAIFAFLCMACDPLGYQAYLPWQLEHLPLETRKRPKVSEKESVSFLSMHEMITATLQTFRCLEKEGNFAKNLKMAADQIKDFSTLDREEFVDFLLWKCLEQKTNELSSLQNLYDQHPMYPKYWKQDVKSHIRSMQNQISSKIIVSDFELVRAFGPEGAEFKTREFFDLFSDLLEAWPTVLSATEELKSQGIVLGRTIE